MTILETCARRPNYWRVSPARLQLLVAARRFICRNARWETRPGKAVSRELQSRTIRGCALQNDPPRIPRSPREGEQYRLYFLDGLGHITKLHEFFADDDAAAIKIANGWREGRAMELWCRSRIVERWSHPKSSD